MTNRTRELFDRWSWLGYPIGAVVVGGFLGGVAGNHPRGPDSLSALPTRSSALLIGVFWTGLLVVTGAAFLGFLIGFAADSGAYRRLANGCACSIFGTLLVLIGLGTPIAVCSALAMLSWWAGLGAGPELGALLGAASAAGAISVGTICLLLLGRPLGRYMVKKQREAVEGLEKVTDRP